jgi:hypothetical protein
VRAVSSNRSLSIASSSRAGPRLALSRGKDGVLCRDATDPDHFYLIGEWADIEEHRRIREFVAREIKPEFVQLIEGGHFVPTYAQIVSMTPQEVLDNIVSLGIRSSFPNCLQDKRYLHARLHSWRVVCIDPVLERSTTAGALIAGYAYAAALALAI